MSTLLRFAGISKRFGSLLANDDLSLSFQEGEIHALIGENGAGKSTLMKILFGMLTPDAGKIFWQEQEIQFRSPHEAVRQGIGMVQQNSSLAEQLTVFENIIAGAEPHRWGWVRQEAWQQLEALMRKLDCVLPLAARVAQLTVAQHQLVEILRLLWRKVKLVILDEPTSLLGPVEIQALFRILNNLKRQGVAVVFITHRLKEVLQVADRISVLRGGTLVATVDAHTNEVELARMMFGKMQHHDTALLDKIEPCQDVLLSVQGLEGDGLKNVSFELRRGEVLGVVALPGNGGEALAALLGGTAPCQNGRFVLDGQTYFSPRKARKVGLGYLPEDRMGEAVVLSFSVSENVGLGRIKNFCRKLWGVNTIHWKALRQRGETLKDRFAIRVERVTQAVSTLSGGNVQRLILAREFDANPRVLIMAHPTQGIDVAGAQQIRSWLLEELKQPERNLEAAIIITADLEEIIGISHRIVVLYRGEIQGIFAGTKLDADTLEKIGLLLTGQGDAR